jgi:hypothetical protein
VSPSRLISSAVTFGIPLGVTYRTGASSGKWINGVAVMSVTGSFGVSSVSSRARQDPRCRYGKPELVAAIAGSSYSRLAARAAMIDASRWAGVTLEVDAHASAVAADRRCHLMPTVVSAGER